MNNKAMHKLSYGLYIVTTKDGEKANGCIVNTAIQAASTPNQLCICIMMKIGKINKPVQ